MTEGQSLSIKFEGKQPHLEKGRAAKICAIAGDRSLPTLKPCGSILILSRRNQSRKVETFY
jgi:hypothetical protein